MITLTANISGGTAPITYEWEFDTDIFTLISTNNGGRTINLDLKVAYININVDTLITVTATDSKGCIDSEIYKYVRSASGCSISLLNLDFEVSQVNGDIIFTPSLDNPDNADLNYQWSLTSEYGEIQSENEQLTVRYNFPTKTATESTDQISLLVANANDTDCFSTINCNFTINVDYNEKEQPVIDYNMHCNTEGEVPIIGGTLILTPNPIDQGDTTTPSGVSCSDNEDGVLPITYWYSLTDQGATPNTSSIIEFSSLSTFDTPGTYYIYVKCEDSDGNTTWTGPTILIVNPITPLGDIQFCSELVDTTFNSGNGALFQINVTSLNATNVIDTSTSVVYATFYSDTIPNTQVSSVLPMRLADGILTGGNLQFTFPTKQLMTGFPSIPITKVVFVADIKINTGGIISSSILHNEIEVANFATSQCVTESLNNTFYEDWQIYPSSKTVKNGNEVQALLISDYPITGNDVMELSWSPNFPATAEFEFVGFTPTAATEYRLLFDYQNKPFSTTNIFGKTFDVMQGTTVLSTGTFTSNRIFLGEFTTVSTDNIRIVMSLQDISNSNPVEVYFDNFSITQI